MLTNINEIESESEDAAEFGVKIYEPKHAILPTKKRIYCIIFTVIVVICMVIAITLIWPKNNTKQTENQEESFYTLQHLMEDESFDNNNDDGDNYKYFDAAFKIFDVNNDGYLNETEFSNYFVMQLNYSNAFEVMDADKDNILSYPEVVVYQQKLNEIASIKQNTLTTMVNAVETKYGYEYSSENTDTSFDTFLEFVVILEYFETFDIDKNGYITHEEFIRIAAKQEFETYDFDGNGKISRDDFFDILFGDDENSWKGKLKDIFGDSYEEIMNKVGAINITPDMVKNVQITVSPIQTLRTKYKHERRRLCTSTYVCSWTYSSGCRCHTYTCQWTCS